MEKSDQEHPQKKMNPKELERFWQDLTQLHHFQRNSREQEGLSLQKDIIFLLGDKFSDYIYTFFHKIKNHSVEKSSSLTCLYFLWLESKLIDIPWQDGSLLGLKKTLSELCRSWYEQTLSSENLSSASSSVSWSYSKTPSEQKFLYDKAIDFMRKYPWPNERDKDIFSMWITYPPALEKPNHWSLQNVASFKTLGFQEDKEKAWQEIQKIGQIFWREWQVWEKDCNKNL